MAVYESRVYGQFQPKNNNNSNSSSLPSKLTKHTAVATVPSLTKLCTLGRGTTATVSLASDLDSGRLYAIKSAEMSVSSPLQHEQRILSSLSSPHIIYCHGSYISDYQFHLLLEFASCGSLFDRINGHTEGRLDERDIRSHARDILLGLSYLHSNSITHGDIKSQNILIGSDGRAKIADFGDALQTGGTHDQKPGQLSGTPAFMAPEVARGVERGPAADICTVIEIAIPSSTGVFWSLLKFVEFSEKF
ncbi:mitogen-activated protein kinase kinase kinase 18-like [Carex rostrata]